MTTIDPYMFASYSLKDRGSVVPFIERVRDLGVNVFYDGSLRPGEDWEHALTRALDRAAGLLVFVSPRSMQSEWVRKELQYALGRKGGDDEAPPEVLPVVIEGPPPPPPPEELAHLHFNDYLLYLMQEPPRD